MPEINEEWYNYDKQEWANAVVLGKGKTKKPGDTVAVDGTEALMMLVYIPRYEYKIEGKYGIHTDGTKGTQELPGEIEVKFVNTNQTKSDDSYIMHPAFTFGDKELNGIWVGKFELSHETLSESTASNNLGCSTTNCTNAQGLRILPNVESLRYNNVSNFWYGIRSIENTNLFGLKNVDTHMIKNSEWGAVAYLSQSKYGKYGNSDYEGTNKEIYQRKKMSIVGSSNGTPATDNSNKLDPPCLYYDMTNLGLDSNNKKRGQCGPGASTTGNIYGIYDMNGGAYEYVMGVYGEINPTIQNSGFDDNVFNDEIIKEYYYNLYITNDYETACNGVYYGQGYETSNWYNNSNFVNNYSWLANGGCYNDLNTGIFSINLNTGNKDPNRTSRVIFVSKN